MRQSRQLNNRRVYYIEENMTKQIPLTQGLFALVDDEDFEYLNQWKWQAQKHRNTFYATRKDGVWPNRKEVKMHRVIMNTPAGVETDHWDGDGLNNRRMNLRVCATNQNQHNRTRKNANNTSGYKGVTPYRRTDKENKWKAQLVLNGKLLYLGLYATPEDAARAYDRAAREYFGDFAATNFPE